MLIKPSANFLSAFRGPGVDNVCLSQVAPRVKYSKRYRGFDTGKIGPKSHIRLHRTSTLVDPPGIEPGSPVCRTGVVPLDHEPIQSGEWGSNPRSPASKAGGSPLSNPLSSGPRGTCTLISGVRSRRRPVGPAAQVIPDGLEPSLPGSRPGVFAAGPRDQQVAEVGIEPTNSHQALDLAALPVCVLGQRSCGGRIRTAYETVLETRFQSTPQ